MRTSPQAMLMFIAGAAWVLPAMGQVPDVVFAVDGGSLPRELNGMIGMAPMMCMSKKTPTKRPTTKSPTVKPATSPTKPGSCASTYCDIGLAASCGAPGANCYCFPDGLGNPRCTEGTVICPEPCSRDEDCDDGKICLKTCLGLCGGIGNFCGRVCTNL
jgi:hypothetical protein